jgi:hypothetical protein
LADEHNFWYEALLHYCEHFWQVWLKSVQRFQRRRFKCEKLTDGRTLTHDKSSHGLWPGELKMDVLLFIKHQFVTVSSDLTENRVLQTIKHPFLTVSSDLTENRVLQTIKHPFLTVSSDLTENRVLQTIKRSLLTVKN